ncbi:hypothetical protein SAMN05216388_103239 [Halorientalis persicus]|jgi:hypothetical protein|uniref:Uncharacterized protein n=1 Tax=Halorientalis persicus TaxID=1367881 RepID=A0A1H8V2G8_9EURY|nr:hypothetical protein [Halorientalis persicus]SEP09423.1 hypothetical protein SAMN05216388_103239 [Halorientalis persicus]
MPHSDHSHIDEWAALVGEDVGDSAIDELVRAGGDEESVEMRYRDDAGVGTDY